HHPVARREPDAERGVPARRTARRHTGGDRVRLERRGHGGARLTRAARSVCGYVVLDRRPARRREDRTRTGAGRNDPGAAAEPGCVDDPAVRRAGSTRETRRAGGTAHLAGPSGAAPGNERGTRLRALGPRRAIGAALAGR